MFAVFVGFVFAVLLSLKKIKLVLRKKYNHKIIPFLESDFYSDKYDKIKLENLPIIILQPKGPLFFGSIESLINSYSSSIKHEIVIIDMVDVNEIDLSGAYALEDLIKAANSQNIKVFVSNIQPTVRTILSRLDFISNIGKNNCIDSKKTVISTILERYS